LKLTLPRICGLVLASLAVYLSVSHAAHGAGSSVAVPLTTTAYAQGKDTKGVVLLAVRWDRKWRCGGFENAQLRVIGFDRLPSQKTTDEESADVVFDDAPLIATKPTFDDYAMIMEPGEYALSTLQIKVARSVSDVGFFKASRSLFLKDGKAEGGTFNVSAGEVVYIGHFYLDCYKQPTLWRYYMDGRAAFDEYLASVKSRYPMLNIEQTQFRLFKTTVFGNDYVLK